MTKKTTLSYYFDPLCGWCYASAQGLAALAQKYGDRLEMKPTGLFMQPRPVSDIADHAWRNDTRISEISGQPFTEAYHQGIMRKPGGVFSSAPLTLAFVALQKIDHTLGPRFLHEAQTARYVDGLDTSEIAVVATLASRVAAEAGHALSVADLQDRLTSDAQLSDTTNAIAQTAQNEMAAQGFQGVPHLVIHEETEDTPVSGDLLYADGPAVLDTVRTIALAPV